MKVIATEQMNKKRLDACVSQLVSTVTRSQASVLVSKGFVLLNGKKSKKSSSVHTGDVIDIERTVVPLSEDIIAEDIPLDVLFEDDQYIAVNKPAGMLTHPTAQTKNGTLVNALLFYLGKDLSDGGTPERPGIVHRLDKDTSGVLIVAKNNEAHRLMADLIEKREVKKKYTALLYGVLSPPTGTIDAPLQKGFGRKHASQSKVSPSAKAKWAVTHYRVAEVIADRFSLVDVEIVTGRTHQIRVHFSAIGHPVLGDEVYGARGLTGELSGDGLKRQFLHAKSLSFIHPFLKKPVTIEAPLAKDLAEIIDRLRAIPEEV